MILAVCLTAGCSRKSPAAGQNPSQEVQQIEQPQITIHKSDELTMLIRPDYEPFMWVDGTGEAVGWIIDVEKAIMEEMGQNYRMIPYDDAETATRETREGVYHSLVAVPFTPDFEKYFYMAEPWINLGVYIFVHEDTRDIGGTTREKSIRSLYGKTVGIQGKGFSYNLLKDYEEIELVEYPLGSDALRKVADRTVDAKVEILQPALYQAKNEALPVKPAGVPLIDVSGTLGFSRGVDPEIVERYNRALKTIQDNGTFDRIYNQWFGREQ